MENQENLNNLKRKNPENEDIKMIEKAALEEKKRLLPKKGNFRMRAHVNPLKDTPFPYPLNPDFVDWSVHYPMYFDGNKEQNESLYLNTEEHPIEYTDFRVDDSKNGTNEKKVEFVDVGCGYGGLLFALSQQFPDKLSFGLEIRDKLVNYVGEKIRAMRIEKPGMYNNISVIRTNAMRHLVNYFRKGQLLKMFFCFPDPNFKKKTMRRRIINVGYLSEYAYFLQPKGRIYCITDVEDLHLWHEKRLSENPLFKKIEMDNLKDDICIDLIFNETEEGKKVTRNKGSKFVCVYERI